MVILTLNCGSSSIKYQVYDWDRSVVLATGIVERIGIEGSRIVQKIRNEEIEVSRPLAGHREGMKLLLETILHADYGAIEKIEKIRAVGHRVVHGGERFAKSVIITDEAIAVFQSLKNLAPLHTPANLIGIESAQAVLPGVPHCAIMDTAWHQTMPKKAFLYALPYSWYTDYGVRRYGFHGTSFLYTAKRASVLLEKDPFMTKAVIAHIGNGSSINAVQNGISVDTSMGLTPLEGLVMGTRAGDHDPAIAFHMMKRARMTPEEVEDALNRKSGILGISQRWTDRRDIEAASREGDELATLTQKIEAYRIKKYIGAYCAALGGTDAIVFTAGVGERGPVTRLLATEGLDWMGIKIDPAKNRVSMTRNAETCISVDDSPTKIFVIPTNEELVMTEDTYALLNGTYDIHTNYEYHFQAKDYVNQERAENLPRDIKKWKGLEKIVL